MTTTEIEILPLRRWNNGNYARLYYYQGNFFGPLFPAGDDIGRIKGHIRIFLRNNRALVMADRADPEYRTLTQLVYEQWPDLQQARAA